eukprot:6176228-Pleurochrysis_carterae.AAC.2
MKTYPRQATDGAQQGKMRRSRKPRRTFLSRMLRDRAFPAAAALILLLCLPTPGYAIGTFCTQTGVNCVTGSSPRAFIQFRSAAASIINSNLNSASEDGVRQDTSGCILLGTCLGCVHVLV